MPQTNYDIYMDRGVEGGIPNSRSNCHIGGTQGEYVNGETTDRLPYGRFVQEGANDGEFLNLSGAGNTIAGITVFNEAYEKDENGLAGVPPQEPVSLMEDGELYLIAEVAVSKNDPVFTRHTVNASPGEFDDIGRVRNDADGANADAVPTARFKESVSAGKLVRVYYKK